MSDLVARAGAIMACVNGHALAELTEDLLGSDTNYGRKFKWEFGCPDPTGNPRPLCHECGVPFGTPMMVQRVLWIEKDGTRHE